MREAAIGADAANIRFVRLADFGADSGESLDFLVFGYQFVQAGFRSVDLSVDFSERAQFHLVVEMRLGGTDPKWLDRRPAVISCSGLACIGYRCADHNVVDLLAVRPHLEPAAHSRFVFDMLRGVATQFCV